MVTIQKVERTRIFPDEERILVEIRGLSNDAKPVKMDGKKVDNGSTFVEIDTGKVYMFDFENKKWKAHDGSNDSSYVLNTDSDSYSIDKSSSDYAIVNLSLYDEGTGNNVSIKNYTPKIKVRFANAGVGIVDNQSYNSSTGYAEIKIYGIVAGTTDVTFTIDDLQLTKTVSLEVTGEPQPSQNEIHFEQNSYSMNLNQSNTTVIELTSSNIDLNNNFGYIQLNTSDDSICTVSSSYPDPDTNTVYITIMGYNEGTATITANMPEFNVSATTEIVVTNETVVITFPDQQVEDLSFTNAQVENYEFSCSVTNVGNDTLSLNGIRITLYDVNDNVIAEMDGFVGDNMQPNETRSMSSSYYSLLTDATRVEYSIIQPQPTMDFNEVERVIDTSQSSSATLNLTAYNFDLNDYMQELSITSSDTSVITIDNITQDQSDNNIVHIDITAQTDGNVTIYAEISSLGLYNSINIVATADPTALRSIALGNTDYQLQGIGGYQDGNVWFAPSDWSGTLNITTSSNDFTAQILNDVYATGDTILRVTSNTNSASSGTVTIDADGVSATANVTVYANE